MTTPQVPAGWYPDPSGAAGERWWTGVEWSTETRLAPQPEPVTTPSSDWNYVGTPQNATSSVFSSSTYGYPPLPTPVATVATGSRNKLAFTTFAVVAVYLVIALETRVVIFGILPIGLAIRSQRRHEPLAPLAFVAAVIAIVVAIARLS